MASMEMSKRKCMRVKERRKTKLRDRGIYDKVETEKDEDVKGKGS